MLLLPYLALLFLFLIPCPAPHTNSSTPPSTSTHSHSCQNWCLSSVDIVLTCFLGLILLVVFAFGSVTVLNFIEIRKLKQFNKICSRRFYEDNDVGEQQQQMWRTDKTESTLSLESLLSTTQSSSTDNDIDQRIPIRHEFQSKRETMKMKCVEPTNIQYPSSCLESQLQVVAKPSSGGFNYFSSSSEENQSQNLKPSNTSDEARAETESRKSGARTSTEGPQAKILDPTHGQPETGRHSQHSEKTCT